MRVYEGPLFSGPLVTLIPVVCLLDRRKRSASGNLQGKQEQPAKCVGWAKGGGRQGEGDFPLQWKRRSFTTWHWNVYPKP